MSADDLKDPINATIKHQIVNKYVKRKTVLRSNLDNIYGLVSGQLSHGIKSIARNN